MKRAALVAALACTTSGCFSAMELVRTRHANEFGCDARTVAVADRTGQHAYFLASGCGMDATYAVLSWRCGRNCVHHLGVMEREWPTGTTPQLASAGGERSPADLLGPPAP